MISDEEWAINIFIENIRNLELAENALELARYIAECNNSKHLAQISQAHHLVCEANENLIKLIATEIKNEAADKIDKTLIAENILKAIAVINNAQDAVFKKAELINMLETCATSFSLKKIDEVFIVIKKDQAQLSEKILLLNEICQDWYSKR